MEEIPVEDRQISENKMGEKLKHLFANEKWCDCAFTVGTGENQKIFKAHKLILGMSSTVFEEMFYGETDDKENPIPVLDISPEAFKELLAYIYTDNLNITTFNQAFDLFYAAKKYILPDLAEKCKPIMLKDLCASNACRAFEFGEIYEETVLKEHSFQMILTETQAALAPDSSFEDVKLSTLLLILDRQDLNVPSEIDLFNAVLRWARKACAREYLSETSTYLRRAVGPALEKIHFLSLTAEEFLLGPGIEPLLTKKDALSILMNIFNGTSTGSKFPMPLGYSKVEEPRQNCSLPLTSIPLRDTEQDGAKCICDLDFQYFIDSQLGMNYHSRKVIGFSVNRDIRMLGIKLAARANGDSGSSYKERMDVAVYDSQFIVTKTENFFQRPCGKEFEINFSTPIKIVKDETYSVHLLPNGMYSVGWLANKTILCNDVTFDFNSFNDSTILRSIIFDY